jgi:hypothetical protein
MLAELAGYTLTKSIPDNALIGIMSGAYKVYGGVIRNGTTGQIVAHLIDATNPINIATSLFPPLDLVISGINTVQLSRIGANISQLITLAQGTMALSGLTLAVSAASFVFLNNKLNSIDSRLVTMSDDIKAIKKFLELQERARLATAFKTMQGLDDSIDIGLREKLLVGAKQTLGEIHEKYRELLMNIKNVEEALAIEEYFTVTALGHALCTAELDMHKQAKNELKEAYNIWSTASERISRDFVLRDEPERFMQSRYAAKLKTDEMVDWLDFGYQTNRGIEWIDDLRGKNSWMPKIPTKLNAHEGLELEIMRKLVQRDRIYQSYIGQYEYLSETSTRPSIMQNYIESIPENERVQNSYVFVANDLPKSV